MDDKTDPHDSFWMPDHDPQGGPIDQRIINAAQRIWPQVVETSRRNLRDQHLAFQLLEMSVYAVSKAIKRRHGREPIEDLDAYLFLAFRRFLNRIKKKEEAIEAIEQEEVIEWNKLRLEGRSLSLFDKDLLVGQIIESMDLRTRDIYLMRVAGLNWSEIGQELGMSGNEAGVVYNQGLKRTKSKLLKGKSHEDSAPGGAKGAYEKDKGKGKTAS